jgi:hypothetical protein
MVQVLVDHFNRDWWKAYAVTLADRFHQESIHIRALPAETPSPLRTSMNSRLRSSPEHRPGLDMNWRRSVRAKVRAQTTSGFKVVLGRIA